jgi:streptomycin 6-kinase
LARLPTLVADLGERWSLSIDRAVQHIKLNYVAPATRADGTRCILKVSRHVAETRSEIAALRLWNGHGSARLMEADPDIGALLVERLEPGTLLVDLAATDDDAATRIAATVLAELWRPLPAAHELRSLASWCDAYERNRAALLRGVDGFPVGLFERADALRRELLDSGPPPLTLHGDVHHYNILRAQRAEWLSIDPKGLAGDPCFDVCQFLRNPTRMPLRVNRRRLEVFCVELGLDHARTRDWCVVHAVLDACWDFEDGSPSLAEKVGYAQELLAL